MGCCSTKLTVYQKEAIAESNKLDKMLGSQQLGENKVLKLLLLGTGSSGKSTVFRQMQLLYNEGFSDFDKKTYRHVIRRNVVESMQALIEGAEKFNYKFRTPQAQQAAQRFLELDPLSANFWVDEIVTDGKLLWSDQAIVLTYENRSRLQLLDSTQYLYQNLDRIGDPKYTPTAEDILRARLRTSGIVERTFRINNVDFKFIDVGGQRNERRKWIHCFEGVTAVFFLAAISEYDQFFVRRRKSKSLTRVINRV